MVDEYNILIASVGGQGGVTLSKILSQAAINQGLNVRVGETLGMAQRGGAVQSYIRIGNAVHSPLIPLGRANVLLSLEPSESLRNIEYMSPRTRVVLDVNFIYTLPMMLGEEKPLSLDVVTSALRSISKEVYAIDARRIAASLDAPASFNVVFLGSYAALGDEVLSETSIMRALEESLPKRYLEQNIRAYEAGYREIRALKNLR